MPAIRSFPYLVALLAVQRRAQVRRIRRGVAFLLLFCALCGGAVAQIPGSRDLLSSAEIGATGGRASFSARTSAPTSETVRTPGPVAGSDADKRTWHEQRAVREISLDISLPPGTSPEDYFARRYETDDQPRQTYEQLRADVEFNYCWEAPKVAVYPAYFDDVPLERYGFTAPAVFQPFLSGAKFYGDVLLLPYKIGSDPLRKRHFVLGYARPGTPTQPVRPWLPWSWRGALFQAGAATGVTYVLP